MSFALGIVVAVTAVVVAFQVIDREPERFAVDACVSIQSQVPVAYDCADSSALYRIVGREAMRNPIDSACLKYADATRAIASTGDSETALCLAPTRLNMSDPAMPSTSSPMSRPR
ncbi:hypothetical protein OHB26_04230 [Nocardia sp. NBC_01503]|uniref:hypothetical protein n=1 Tax=Nocardia sp. NBC_01503 TaxID=2975997 RepID=UPI002E7B9820|nr:hypothetical protein [Nocardia sp. NBC_01503]WTL33458.1 hypothetical protein OHB26_04230 [Nocardia sp. NBC_01503]